MAALIFKKKQMAESVKIKSFTRDAWYAVNTELPYCTCPSFQKSQKSSGQWASTCKHLDALGLHVSKPHQSKTHPTFSQALCALVKGIRIRNVEEVVYWMWYMESGGYPDPSKTSPSTARFRMARRILIGAAEDGMSLAVMEKVAANFWKMTKRTEAEFVHLVAEVVRICKVPNWWSDPGGQQYIHQSLVGWNQGMYAKPFKKVEDALKVVEEAIDAKDMALALGTFSRLDQIKDVDFGSTKQAEWLFEVAKKREHGVAMRFAQLHLKQKTALSGDNNFLAQGVWHLSGGQTDVVEAIEPVIAGECYELIEKAKDMWKTPHPCPSWSLDGVHCAGNDRRFMGMLANMMAATNAYKHYGRLDPSDEWLPEFRCYDGLVVENA